MTTTFRALCAELVEAWYGTSDFDFNDFGHAAADIVTRARAALAEQPVAPTDEELEELFYANDNLSKHCEAGTEQCIAAALRAAAMRTLLTSEHYEGSTPNDYELGWNAAVAYIQNIADELEAQ